MESWLIKPSFIRQIRYIPTLPSVLTHLLEMIDTDESGAKDVERIIRHDQALTSKVLSVANSAYYGFRYQITTVRRAVVALGYDEIRNICLGASLMGFLNSDTFDDPEAAGQLWLHSLAVSEAARLVGQASGGIEPGQVFTAGLLHDLGKVILAAFFPEKLRELNGLIASEKVSFRQAEAMLDLRHTEVGRALGEHWELPPLLGEVMAWHHEPAGNLPDAHLVACVHLGDFLARTMQIGDSGNNDEPRVDQAALSILRLTRRDIVACHQKLEERREAVENLWHTLTI